MIQVEKMFTHDRFGNHLSEKYGGKNICNAALSVQRSEG